MADVVYSYLERMIPDLEQLQSFEVFSPVLIPDLPISADFERFSQR
jgi:hypothetical protein